MLRRRVLGLADRPAFDSVLFRQGDPETCELLESGAASLRAGFNDGLRLDVTTLLARWDDQPVEARLFWVEGAAMACALLDLVPLPGRGRWERLCAAQGGRWGRVLHIGRGWAYAAARRAAPDPGAPGEDPAYAGVPWEGVGFHDTVFDVVKPPSGPARRPYVHGVGRALWFTSGAQPTTITPLLDAQGLGIADHDDVWSGVGFAATTVGAATDWPLRELSALPRTDGPVAAGAAAAKLVLERAGLDTARTRERACLLGAPVERLAAETVLARGAEQTLHARSLAHFAPPSPAAPRSGDRPEAS